MKNMRFQKYVDSCGLGPSPNSEMVAKFLFLVIYLAKVFQKSDNAIHRINLYPLDSAIGFPNTYPQDTGKPRD